MNFCHRFLATIPVALCALMPTLHSSPAQAATTVVSGLNPRYRSGQIFLTWKEAETPAGTTFNIYVSPQPITAANLQKATKVGHHIEQHSARDWWQDPVSFAEPTPAPKPDAPPAPTPAPVAPAGFLIQEGGTPLDPNDGLFVHTLNGTKDQSLYFAVTTTDVQGHEDTSLAVGGNVLAKPVTGHVAPIEPIWQMKTSAPTAASGKGKNLLLFLHARGGGKTAGPEATSVNYLLFTPASQGWREGLSFKFKVDVNNDSVRLAPCDRTWTNRPVMESGDARDHVKAINTWWFGYNEKIYETTNTNPKIVPNYTEQKLLWLVKWAQDYFGTDPNRTYITGTSMGGSGSVAMSLHHPDVFAAAVANVPVVSLTTRGGGRGSLVRLDGPFGTVDETTVDQNGTKILELMNGEYQINHTRANLPYMFLIHGRTDGSIPWPNNPPFYHTMTDAKQGFAVYWNNGDHSTAVGLSPEDVRGWIGWLNKFALNQSYLVFTNSSDNRNAGNGDRKDGDIVGWINRGLSWKEISDTPQNYSVTVTASYPDIQYPLHVDVTPRRLQQFKVKAGDVVHVQVGQNPVQDVRADADGMVTIPAVTINDAAGTRISLTR